MTESELLELLWRAYEEGAQDGYACGAFERQEDFEKWAREELLND